MSTTVADLLKLPLYQEHAHVASSDGLKNEVTYFTIMEAPDFHFDSLNAHVFILTTLSAHCGSLEKINHVIQGLCEAGVAAIGIKLGRFIDTIDPATLEIAHNYGVPLITFSNKVLFREVLSESLSLILDNQRQMISQLNGMNRELFDAILKNSPLKDVIRILCEKVECYGCCTDFTGAMMAEASSLTTDFDADTVQMVLHAFLEAPDIDPEQHYVKQGNVLLFPCRAQGELLGVLCIVMAEDNMELVLPLAEALTNALSIKFLEHSLKQRTEREMITAILDDVLFQEHRDEKAIVDRLTLLNFKPWKYHMLVVLRGHDQNYADRHSAYTLDIIQNIFAQRFDSVLVFMRGNRYITLLSYKKEKAPAAITSIMRYCGKQTEEAILQRLDVGCSMPITNFCQMPECYRQAQNAIQYGRTFQPDNRIYLYSDYIEMALISHGLNTTASAIFCTQIINPIRQYDEKYKSELWPTLECCFTTSTLEKAASALFIHISTLRYRLQKIQALTGYNYFDIKGKMSLYMAYLLYKVSENQEME